MSYIKNIFIIVSIFSAQLAFAIPVAPEVMTSQKLMSFRPSGDFRAATFRSIVALSNCSGSLVRYQHSLGTDRAMVLTNGHCIGSVRGFLKPGQVVLNYEVSRGFGLLNEDGSRVANLKADKILFATMTHSDMALYQLDKSFDELKAAYGVTALVISGGRSTETTPIAVVSGYWKRIYTCSIKQFIFALKEDAWTFKDSIKYAQPGCETIGGTSGSPIINTNTYEVVGVNNTGNESGGKCGMNNPCEIDQNGKVTVEKGASYGQQIHWVYGCLNQNRQFDLNIAGCKLKP